MTVQVLRRPAPEELLAIAAGTFAECDTALSKLPTVDPETLSPRLRALYEQTVRLWRELRALTEKEARGLVRKP